MSIMRCDKHGTWDSDKYESCPRCIHRHEQRRDAPWFFAAGMGDGAEQAYDRALDEAADRANLDYYSE